MGRRFALVEYDGDRGQRSTFNADSKTEILADADTAEQLLATLEDLCGRRVRGDGDGGER